MQQKTALGWLAVVCLFGLATVAYVWRDAFVELQPWSEAAFAVLIILYVRPYFKMLRPRTPQRTGAVGGDGAGFLSLQINMSPFTLRLIGLCGAGWFLVAYGFHDGAIFISGFTCVLPFVIYFDRKRIAEKKLQADAAATAALAEEEWEDSVYKVKGPIVAAAPPANSSDEPVPQELGDFDLKESPETKQAMPANNPDPAKKLGL